MIRRYSIDIEEALAVLRTAVAAANSSPVSVAVTDEAGVLLVFQRMNGARPHTVELAIQKARTSAVIGASTATIHAAGRADVLPGGVPLVIESDCVGAVGVSGALPAEDVRIAEASLAVLVGRSLSTSVA